MNNNDNVYRIRKLSNQEEMVGSGERKTLLVELRDVSKTLNSRMSVEEVALACRKLKTISKCCDTQIEDVLRILSDLILDLTISALISDCKTLENFGMILLDMSGNSLTYQAEKFATYKQGKKQSKGEYWAFVTRQYLNITAMGVTIPDKMVWKHIQAFLIVLKRVCLLKL